MAGDTTEMIAQVRALLANPAYAAEMAWHGRETVLKRHTCRHRVDELLEIVDTVRKGRSLS
jgi:spore maturation protein CgeB